MLVKKEGGMMRKFDNKPVPFYFINDTIDKAEVVRQLNLIKHSGGGSLFYMPETELPKRAMPQENFFPT